MLKPRKRKTLDPCPVCRTHRSRCICSVIPKLSLRTKLSLVIHYKELKRTSNSGMLAAHALENSEVLVRGQRDYEVDLSCLLDSQYETYVLFPSDNAVDISEIKYKASKPIQLIVSDGNWRQASKLNQRHKELAHLPRAKINRPNMATEHLRREHFAEGYSTLEAIAIALGQIEGEAVERSLLALYQAKLQATIDGRPNRQEL